MIYDIKLHESHCIKSPFTCLDWQRTNLFFKKHLSKIYKIRGLQPNYFFNSRRSASEYLSEIKKNKISYRIYNFKDDKILEEKKEKEMNIQDKIEFSYHIVRFLMMNFVKLYCKKNKNYKFKKLLQIYFDVFPKNKKIHQKLIKILYNLKQKRKFTKFPNLIKRVEFFIRDFELQFKNYFYKNSTEIYFLRHARTELNKKNLFIGQKLDPNIIKPNENSFNNLKEDLKKIDMVFTSPSKRCKNTLRFITNKKPAINNNLAEINYGEVDGKTLDYLSLNYPYIIEAWERGEDPKFPRGENNLDVIKRAKEFIIGLKKQNNKKILVCTHNVVLRTIIGSYFKIPVKNWFKINISYLEPIKFIMPKDNRFYIELTDNQRKEIFKFLK